MNTNPSHFQQPLHFGAAISRIKKPAPKRGQNLAAGGPLGDHGCEERHTDSFADSSLTKLLRNRSGRSIFTDGGMPRVFQLLTRWVPPAGS